MQWTLTPKYWAANHAPRVRIVSFAHKVRAGQTLRLWGYGVDPDALDFAWWQYREEGTYPGLVQLGSPDRSSTTVRIPQDAQPGQTISLILQATDDGMFPLTRYDRVILKVR